MVNYSNSKIYKLVNNDDDECIYVGSTCGQYLSTRMAKHRQEYYKYPEREVYKYIKNNTGIDNIKIVLIETHDCKSKDELEKQERKYILELKPIGNSIIPTQTRKEHYDKNKVRICLKQAEKINCDCGGKYTYGHKSRHLKSKKHLKFINAQS